jgi:hypothetical protein
MIKLACPNCTKQLAVEDSTAGSVCKCPACASKFRVPDAPPKSERNSASKSRATDSKRSSGRESGVVKGEPVADSTGSAARKPRSPRDSEARSGGSSRNGSNGVALDRLEVVAEDDGPRRRPSRRRDEPEPTPSWLPVVAAVGAVTGCALLGLAFFFKFAAIALFVIGLPAALMGRKWQMLGVLGVTYVLSGAGLFVLHNTLLRQVDGPPPDNATARVIDSHCEALLRDRNKKDAGSWIGVERPSDTTIVRGLRSLVKGAYDAGAYKVWLTNFDRLDEVGNPIPNMVVELPDEEGARKHVLEWYQLHNRKRVPGTKYLYVDWD